MIQQLVRPEVARLVPYQADLERSQYRIFLDANESSAPLRREIRQEMIRRFQELELHRYPDPESLALREKIARYLGDEVNPEQILVGNGSDELLNQLTQTFVRSGEGVIALSPTFSMYQIFTQLAGGVYHSYPLTSEGRFELAPFLELIQKVRPKLIFLCSPNNPTGTMIPLREVVQIARSFQGILVVDEAYAEFCQETVLGELNQLPNLVVTRTFSKAFGLAAVRLGYLVANLPVIQEISKGSLPYRVNAVSQMMGEVILDYLPEIQTGIERMKIERKRVQEALQDLLVAMESDVEDDGGNQKGILGRSWQLLPSYGNFLYLKGTGVGRLADGLRDAGIRIRRFDSSTDSTNSAVRITIGTPIENDQVIQVIRTLQERGSKDGTNCYLRTENEGDSDYNHS